MVFDLHLASKAGANAFTRPSETYITYLHASQYQHIISFTQGL